MKEKTKDIIIGIAGTIVFTAVMFAMFMYATSAECWYAGMHDAQHEGENCHCYERLLEQDAQQAKELHK